jgi:hypothetical protein
MQTRATSTSAGIGLGNAKSYKQYFVSSIVQYTNYNHNSYILFICNPFDAFPRVSHNTVNTGKKTNQNINCALDKK